MKQVQIRNMVLGDGQVKICVPLLAKTRIELTEQLAMIRKHAPDMIEFRADWYEAVMEKAKLCATLGQLREQMGERPLLFTFRSKAEGGERSISWNEYKEMLSCVAESHLVDAIDVEVFMQEDDAPDLIAQLQKNEVKVIGSNHHFSHTPSLEEMKDLLCRMQRMGVDVAKLAVMPQGSEDVLALLQVTYDMALQQDMVPVITMAMGKLGVISRMCGSMFGNVLTFASVAKQSAPGQIHIEKLRESLEFVP